MDRLIDREVKERLERLDLPFNRQGFDRYGVSKERLGLFFTMLKPLYRSYFRVECHGIEQVPGRGRVMLIGNHSGGLPVDAGMVIASMFFDHEPPRLIHGMVEKFAATWPILSHWFDRVGQFTGLPEHAHRILDEDRALLVFPEGARGTGKLWKDRYKLVRFGTGFLRLALQTKTPIVPFAFVGGEEALPTVYHAKLPAKLFGAPYWPVPPYILPVPLPRACAVHYGPPMRFEGDGNEGDAVIEGYIHQVRAAISDLIARGRRLRGEQLEGDRSAG